MTIKLFLPQQLFYTKKSCDIYGEIKIGEENCISYYIITAINNNKIPLDNLDSNDYDYEREVEFTNELRHLGHIVKASESLQLQHKDVALVFVYDDETPNIYLNKLSIRTAQAEKVNVFLYNESSILKLQDLNENLSNKQRGLVETNGKSSSAQELCPDEDLHMLFQLQQSKEVFMLQSDEGDVEDAFKRFVGCLLRFPFELLMSAFGFCMTQPPFKYVFQYTFMCDYYKEWLKFKKSG